jgi:hypothetical protein
MLHLSIHYEAQRSPELLSLALYSFIPQSVV